MSEANYYPLGAYGDPDAPRNEGEASGRKPGARVGQVPSKSIGVAASDCHAVTDCPDADDGKGRADGTSASGTNREKAYEEGHYTPWELIRICGKLAEHVFDTNRYATGKVAGFSLRELLTIIDECDNWTDNERDVGEG